MVSTSSQLCANALNTEPEVSMNVVPTNLVVKRKEIKPPLEVPAWSIAIFAVLAIADVAYVCYGFYKAFHLDSWWYMFLLAPFLIPNAFIIPLYRNPKSSCLRTAGRVVYTFPFGFVGYTMLNFIACAPILLFWFIPSKVDLGQVLFSVIIGTTVLIYLYSLVVGLIPPKTYRYKINLNSKGKDDASEYNKLTLVHLSDLHLGCTVGESTGRTIIKKVVRVVGQEAKKHKVAVVVTGDISDMDNRGFEKIGVKLWKEMMESFSDINKNYKEGQESPRVQTFAILGNHDLYEPTDFSQLLKPAIVLRQGNDNGASSHYSLDVDGNAVQIFGINSDQVFNVQKQFAKVTPDSSEEEERIIVHKEPFVPKILLEHEPVKRAGYDIVLAGHTHAGQLLHFGIVTKIVFPLFMGYYFRDGTHYIVSRGTCWWGPRLRWVRGEIGVIKLRWKN